MRLLKEHTQKYFWMQTSYSNSKVLGVGYFLSELKKILKQNVKEEYEKSRNSFQDLVRKKKELLKTLQLSDEAKFLISVIDEFGNYQDKRKAIIMKWMYYADNLLKEMGKRKGYNLKEMKHMTWRELDSLFDGQKIDKNELTERVKYHAYIQDKDGITILTGNDAKKFEDKLRNEIKHEDKVEGLGEQLVSGQVTPNTYFMNKRSHKVEDKSVHFEADEKMVEEVSRIGEKIEDHYKKPMDVEFAIDKKGKLFILQARSITTL